MPTLYTIGHSNHTLKELIDLLLQYKIKQLVDVRTIPRSRRNPWFNQEKFHQALSKHKIKYIHLKELGGLRHAKKDSINKAWINDSFRGFADYMQTQAFFEGLFTLNYLLKHRKRTTIMCAEALPWRCHRSLIADAEEVRKIKVKHIISRTSLIDHELTSFARIDRTKRPIRVYYPK